MPDIPPIFRHRKRPDRAKARAGGSAHLRDTSATYRRQRDQIFAVEALCRYCRARGRITAATVLDHILALALGGTNDRSNLAPACRACNDAKALIERRYIARGYDTADARLDPELAEWLRLSRQVTESEL